MSTSSYSKPDAWMASAVPAIGPTLQQEFHKVVDYARFFKIIRTVVSHGNRAFRDDNIFYADASFLSMFTFPMIKGNADEALTAPKFCRNNRNNCQKIFW